MANNQRKNAAMGPQPKQQRRKKQHKSNTRGRNAPAAQGSRVGKLGPGNERAIVVSGNGRVGQTTIQANIANDGQVLLNLEVNPSMFPRLKRIASAYQRYRFTDLRFVVQPMCPSTTGGGWVAGVIPDPLDTNFTFDALQATLGAKVNKWWEASEIPALSLPRDKLWTSEGENARLYSPGRFILLAVGTNTDLVNVSVVCHWRCELTIPSLEGSGPEPEKTKFTTIVPVSTKGLNGKNYFPMVPYFGPDTPRPGKVYQSDVPIGINVSVQGGAEFVQYSDFMAGSDGNLTYGIATWDDAGTGWTAWNGGAQAYETDDMPEGIVLPKGLVLSEIPHADFREGAAAL